MSSPSCVEDMGPVIVLIEVNDELVYSARIIKTLG